MPEHDGFEERLRKARSRHGVDPTPNAAGQTSQGNLGFGFRAGVEVFSALVVGIAVGFVLDRWLGTWPWLFILFFVLGSVAGVLNVYRLFNLGPRRPG